MSAKFFNYCLFATANFLALGCAQHSHQSSSNQAAFLATSGDGGYVPPPTDTGGDGGYRCPSTPMRTGTGFNGTVNQIRIDPADCNRVYVSGDFTAYNGVALASQHLVRLNQDGTLDETFRVGTGPDAHLSAIAIMNDGSGRVYLGGSFRNFAGQPLANLVRIFPTGAVDPTFKLGSGFDDGVFRVIALNDGTNRLYAVGFFSQFNGAVAGNIVRLNADGSADPAFHSGTGFDALVQNIAIDPGNPARLYAAGDFRMYDGKSAPSLIRLNADGTKDETFAIGSGFDSLLFGITAAIDGSNKIYVTTGCNPATGLPPKFQGVSVPIGLVRINPDGSLDRTFNTGSGFVDPSNGWGAVVFNVAIATDGTNKIYAAGQFPTVNGFSQQNIVRLNSDGSVDRTFSTGSGFNAASYFPMLVGDGTNDVYFYGTYSTYAGQTVGGLLRLAQDGSLSSR